VKFGNIFFPMFYPLKANQHPEVQPIQSPLLLLYPDHLTVTTSIHDAVLITGRSIPLFSGTRSLSINAPGIMIFLYSLYSKSNR